MKKLFAIFVAMIFVASLSFSIVGCKKAEEPTPAGAPKVDAPARRSEAAPAIWPLPCSCKSCT